MRRLIATLLLLLVSLRTSAAFAASIDLDQQHRATHHISQTNVVEEAECSATAVAPHTLLTAGHCLLTSNEINIDGTDAQIRSLQFDDFDHMLVEVDATFSSYLPIEERGARTGELVHMWGNPGRSRDVFRWGRYDHDDTIGDTPAQVYQLPVFPGDSGSGIITSDGTVITVVSIGDNSANMIAFPLQFTPSQLASIK